MNLIHHLQIILHHLTYNLRTSEYVIFFLPSVLRLIIINLVSIYKQFSVRFLIICWSWIHFQFFLYEICRLFWKVVFIGYRIFFFWNVFKNYLFIYFWLEWVLDAVSFFSSAFSSGLASTGVSYLMFTMLLAKWF